MLQRLLPIAGKRVLGEAAEALYLAVGADLTRPTSIRGLFTERCNYRCKSCGCWRKPDADDELTPAEWQKALADLKDFLGAYCIQFSGGEPFVYRGLLSILGWCGEHGVAWGMISNGSAFTAANSRAVMRAGPQNLDISVDGATPEVHDASRGVAGSLRRIEASLAHLLEARAAVGSDCPLRIKVTVHRGNLGELPAIADWAIRQGATSIDYSPVRPWSPEVRSELWIGEAEQPALERAVDELIAAKRRGLPIETEEERMRGWTRHFRHETVSPSLAPCRVGFRDFHILPNGDVRMCWEYPVVGNLRRASPREIWHGPIARQQRRAMVSCANFGSELCATSCLAHRTLGEDWRRVRVIRRARAGSQAEPSRTALG